MPTANLPNGQWRKAAVAFELAPGAKHINLDLFNFFAKRTVWWDDAVLRFDVAEATRREEHRRLEAQRAQEAAAMIGDIANASLAARLGIGKNNRLNPF